EPDAEVVRNSAHSFLKFLIGGFSLIYSKEQLSGRILGSIQVLLQSKCKNFAKELIDITATTIVNDNIDLCVCYVQKTCMDRAIDELDTKLKVEYEIRRNPPDGLPYF